MTCDSGGSIRNSYHWAVAYLSDLSILSVPVRQTACLSLNRLAFTRLLLVDLNDDPRRSYSICFCVHRIDLSLYPWYTSFFAFLSTDHRT
jgi:hypothetical protein